MGFIVRSSGINLKAHVKARVDNVNAYADKLHLAGARWKNFPAYVNIQCYAAFIRLWMEYGVQLIPPGHSCLYLLQQCQKRILCKFLGTHVNARNDVVEPAFHVAKLCRISTAWTSEKSNDFALLFVIRGISGDTIATPLGILLKRLYVHVAMYMSCSWH